MENRRKNHHYTRRGMLSTRRGRVLVARRCNTAAARRRSAVRDKLPTWKGGKQTCADYIAAHMGPDKLARLDMLRTIARARVQEQETAAAIAAAKKSGKGARKNARRVYSYYIVRKPAADTYDASAGGCAITDTAHAYMRNAAKILTTRAIKDLYARTGAPYTYKVWTQATDAAARDATTGELDNLVQLDSDAGTLNQSQASDAQKQLAILASKPVAGKGAYKPSGGRLQYRKPCKRKIGTYKIIRRRRATGEEYAETHGIYTRGYRLADHDLARVYMDTTTARKQAARTAGEYDDLVMIAYTELLQMARDGAIVDYADVWTMRRRVYSAVQVEMRKSRRIDAEITAYSAAAIMHDGQDSDAPEIVVDVPYVDANLANIANSEAVKMACYEIAAQSRKKQNVARNAAILYDIAQGYDLQAAAARNGVTPNGAQKVLCKAREYAARGEVQARIVSCLFG